MNHHQNSGTWHVYKYYNIVYTHASTYLSILSICPNVSYPMLYYISYPVYLSIISIVSSLWYRLNLFISPVYLEYTLGTTQVSCYPIPSRLVRSLYRGLPWATLIHYPPVLHINGVIFLHGSSNPFPIPNLFIWGASMAWLKMHMSLYIIL